MSLCADLQDDDFGIWMVDAAGATSPQQLVVLGQRYRPHPRLSYRVGTRPHFERSSPCISVHLLG